MSAPVIIITGYGVNCEAESTYAWETAGAEADRVHLNEILQQPDRLHNYGALMFIGGFSYGDHMGSGLAFALRIRHHIQQELVRFIKAGKLILGVCNGFQVMTKLGLVPGLDDDRTTQTVTLMQNDCGHFQNYWVKLVMDPASPCVFTRGIEHMELPIRHGEGKLFTLDSSLIDRIERERCCPCRYADAWGNPATNFPDNPNGSINAMAGLCDSTGRVFGLMPHPEAYLFPENHPQWLRQNMNGTLPEHGQGLALFKNAVQHL